MFSLRSTRWLGNVVTTDLVPGSRKRSAVPTVPAPGGDSGRSADADVVAAFHLRLRSSTNRCRLADSGSWPGPFFTLRDDNTTLMTRKVLRPSVETTPLVRGQFSPVADIQIGGPPRRERTSSEGCRSVIEHIQWIILGVFTLLFVLLSQSRELMRQVGRTSLRALMRRTTIATLPHPTTNEELQGGRSALRPPWMPMTCKAS